MFRLLLVASFVIFLWIPKPLYSEENIVFEKLLKKGMENLKLYKYKKAIDYFRRAISVDPKNGDGYFQLAFGLHQLNKFEEALGAYKSGLKLKPDYSYAAEAYFNMTVAADRLGYGEEAIQYLKKSLQAYTERSDYGAVFKIGEFLKNLSDKYPDK